MKQALIILLMKQHYLILFISFIMAINLSAQATTSKTGAKNVLGNNLESCCTDPLTGYFRDGYCHTNAQDLGTHVVCATMTDEFLNYSATCGNDLMTPNPRYTFPGLKAGDKWCLCISRWLEAEEAGVAPPVHLASIEESALKYTTLEKLKEYAVDGK